MTIYSSDDAITDFAGAGYPALKARFKALADVVGAVAAERQALAEEIRRREKEAAARAGVVALTKDGKLALREVVNSPEFAK